MGRVEQGDRRSRGIVLLLSDARNCDSILVKLLAGHWTVLHTVCLADIGEVLSRWTVDLMLVADRPHVPERTQLLAAVGELCSELPILILGNGACQELLLNALCSAKGLEYPLSSEQPDRISQQLLSPTLSLWCSGGKRSAAGIARVVAYIETHYPSPLSLETAARIACYSPCHFSRKFHRQMGMSFVAYLNQVRIHHAQHLLCYSDLPVVRIAQEVGFNDQTHFQRVFRSLLCQSPSRYRQSAQDLLPNAQKLPILHGKLLLDF